MALTKQSSAESFTPHEPFKMLLVLFPKRTTL